MIEADFLSYFTNSVIVTLGATAPAVLLSFMAAFAIVRGGHGWFLRITNDDLPDGPGRSRCRR